MKRLTELNVFSGFTTAWRRAIWPTSFSPLRAKATTDGVVRWPSAFGMMVGCGHARMERQAPRERLRVPRGECAPCRPRWPRWRCWWCPGLRHTVSLRPRLHRKGCSTARTDSDHFAAVLRRDDDAARSRGGARRAARDARLQRCLTAAALARRSVQRANERRASRLRARAGRKRQRRHGCVKSRHRAASEARRVPKQGRGCQG